MSTTGADAVKRDLAGVGQAVDATGQKSSKMGATIGSALRWGLVGAAAGAIAGATAAVGSFIMGASNLAEAQSKVNVVFGESAGVVNTWAKAAADAFGIAEADALAVTGTMGNLFTNMGFTKDQAAGMSTEIVGLSADMASFFNVSQPQVIEALTSAFVGEYDALQRLGVPISAAAVEQYALNEGIWDGVDAMTDAERATAVYGLTMEKTANAQGDFARTSDGLANKTRILKANFANLGASIGKILIPAAVKLTQWGIDAIDWLSEMGNPLDAIADKFGFLGDIFGPIIDAGRDFVDSFRNLTRDVADVAAWGHIITGADGLGALPAFFIALGNTIAGLGGGIPIIEDVGEGLMDIGETIIHLTEAYDHFRTMGLDPVQAGLRAIGVMFPAVSDLAGDLQIAVGRATEAFRDFFSGDIAAGFQGLGSALSAINIGDVVVNIGSWAKGAIADLWPYVQEWASAAVSGVASAAATIWNVLVNLGSWAKGIVSDLAPYIAMWASEAVSAVTSAVATIWNVLVNVGSWAKGIVSDLAPYVAGWASEAVSTITSAAATIWGVLVNIGSWAKGIVSDIGPYVSQFAQEAWDAVRDAPVSVDGALILSIGDVDVDLPVLYASINQAFYDAADLDEGQLTGVHSAGEQVGRSAMRAFLGGLRAVFTGGGDGGGGFGDIASGQVFAPAIRAFFSGMFEGMGDVVSEEVGPRLEALSDTLQAELQSWADSITSLFSNLSIPDITIPDFNITWPTLPGLDSIPFVQDFIGLLGDMRSMFSGLDVSFEIPDITIDWPDVSSVTDSIPQWMKDFVSMNPLDFVKKYLGGGGSGAGGGDGTEGGTGSGDTGFGGGGWGLNRPFGDIDFSSIESGFARVTAAANEARDAIGGVFSGGAGGEGGRGALGGGAGAITGAIAAVQTALSGLAATAQNTAIQMGILGITIGAALGRGIATGVSSMAGAVAGAVGTVLGAANAAGMKGIGIGTSIGSSLGNAIAAGIRGTAGAAAGAVGAVLGAANAAGMKARGIGEAIGRALGEGIVAGLNSMQGAVAAAAAALIAIANGAAAATGGIKSPSTVWAYYGRMFGEGLGVGMGQSETGVVRAAADLIRSANGTLGAPLVAGGGLNAGVPGTGGITITFSGNFYGSNRAELNDWAEQDLLPAIVREVGRRNVALGVTP